MQNQLVIQTAKRQPCRSLLILTVSAFVLPLASCGGNSGSVGSASNGAPVTISPTLSPTPTTTPSPTPAPSPTPTPAPAPSSWTEAAAALYDVAPNAAACSPGTLKSAVRQEFLFRINALRALHGLSPVAYSSVEDTQADQSSLMMAVNRTLSHTPPSSWTCYTSTGSQGAGSSNLIGGWGNGLGWSTEDDNLAGWMTEQYSESLGHRRWILDPFLGKISYGRVAYQDSTGFRADAATLKVFNFNTSPPAPASVPAFVAYPYGNYPARYFQTGNYLSFSVIVSSTSRYANNGVGFSGATVSVSDSSGDLPITGQSADNLGYGIPNSLQWRVTGLQPNVTYTVRITGVTGAPSSSYQYSFKIVP